MLNNNKLFIISLLMLSSFLLLSGCSSSEESSSQTINNSLSQNESEPSIEKTSTAKTNINKVAVIDDLSKIESLKSSKLENDSKNMLLSFDEVISIIGTKGDIAYPDESDETLKVMYWVFEDNGHKYFLDTIFFMDRLVNIESRLVNPSNILENYALNVSSNYEDEIIDIKSLTALKEVFGDAVLGLSYFTQTDDRIYIWKYKDDFISAYTTGEDSVIYTAVSEDVNTLLRSAANCH